MKCDVLIAGGGAAGCATALALQQRGLTTIVLERAAAVMPKVGEHLPPDVKPVLGQLGLWERFLADQHLACPGIRSSWGSSEFHEREYIFSPFGPGWNLDRERFDTMLSSAAEQAGARILYGARLNAINAQAAGWQVEAQHCGGRQLIAADFLIDATGRSAIVARKLGARRLRVDKLVGIIGWKVAGDPVQNSDASLWIEAAETGWWYAARLPSNKIIIAWMTDPLTISQRNGNVQELWQKRLQETVYVRQHMAGSESTQSVAVKPAHTQRMEPAVGARWLAVGDAASAFDPLSSMGITRALRSGLFAAVAIESALCGKNEGLDAYAAYIRQEFDDYLAAKSAYYQQEMRWLEQPFWQSRQLSAGEEWRVRSGK